MGLHSWLHQEVPFTKEATTTSTEDGGTAAAETQVNTNLKLKDALWHFQKRVVVLKSLLWLLLIGTEAGIFVGWDYYRQIEVGQPAFDENPTFEHRLAIYTVIFLVASFILFYRNSKLPEELFWKYFQPKQTHGFLPRQQAADRYYDHLLGQQGLTRKYLPTEKDQRGGQSAFDKLVWRLRDQRYAEKHSRQDWLLQNIPTYKSWDTDPQKQVVAWLLEPMRIQLQRDRTIEVLSEHTVVTLVDDFVAEVMDCLSIMDTTSGGGNGDTGVHIQPFEDRKQKIQELLDTIFALTSPQTLDLSLFFSQFESRNALEKGLRACLIHRLATADYLSSKAESLLLGGTDNWQNHICYPKVKEATTEYNRLASALGIASTSSSEATEAGSTGPQPFNVDPDNDGDGPRDRGDSLESEEGWTLWSGGQQCPVS